MSVEGGEASRASPGLPYAGGTEKLHVVSIITFVHLCRWNGPMVLFLLGKQEVSAVEPSAYKLPFCILLYQIIAAWFCPMKVIGESVHTQIHVHVLVSHVLHVQITMLGFMHEADSFSVYAIVYCMLQW